jgi:hypothetical protein
MVVSFRVARNQMDLEVAFQAEIATPRAARFIAGGFQRPSNACGLGA